jgi:tRNA threonylcarbamoyladenosine biosynthesis protein TsaE
MNREILRQEKIVLKNKSDMKTFLLKLAQGFKERQILLLQGPMGSGKTQFVSWLAQAFADARQVSSGVVAASEAASPTYAFHHRYQLKSGTIEHFDLDRIQSESDLESIGFWDIFAIDAAWVIIEWPERINLRHLPKNWALTHIKIERVQSATESEERAVEVTIY